MSDSYPLSTVLALSISLGVACLILLALTLFLWVRYAWSNRGNSKKPKGTVSKKTRQSYGPKSQEPVKPQHVANNNLGLKNLDVNPRTHEQPYQNTRATHSGKSVYQYASQMLNNMHDYHNLAAPDNDGNSEEANKIRTTYPKKLVLPQKFSNQPTKGVLGKKNKASQSLHDQGTSAAFDSSAGVGRPNLSSADSNGNLSTKSALEIHEQDMSLRSSRRSVGMSRPSQRIESESDLSSKFNHENKLLNNRQSNALGSFRINTERRLSLQPPPRSPRRQRGSRDSSKSTSTSPHKISPLRIPWGPIYTDNNKPLSVTGSSPIRPVLKANTQSPHLETPPTLHGKKAASISSAQSTPMYTANESLTMSSCSKTSLSSRRAERDRLNNKSSSYSLQGQHYRKLSLATTSTSPERVLQPDLEQATRARPMASMSSVKGAHSSSVVTNFYANQHSEGLHAHAISKDETKTRKRLSNESLYLATQILPPNNNLKSAQDMLGEILSQHADIHESNEHVGRVHVENGHSFVPSISGSLVDPHIIDASSFVPQVPEAAEVSSDTVSREALSHSSNCPTPPDKILRMTKDSLIIDTPSPLNLENEQEQFPNSSGQEEEHMVKLKSPLSFVDLSDPTRLSRSSSLAASQQSLSSSFKDASWGKLPSSPIRDGAPLDEIGFANGIKTEASIQHNSKLRSIRNIAALEPPKSPRSPGYEPRADARLNGKPTRKPGFKPMKSSTYVPSSAARTMHKPISKASLINKPLPSTPSAENGVIKHLGGAKFVVAMRYVPRLSDELDLEPGDVVRVYEMFDDGWCVGRVVQGNAAKQGTRGVYPILCLTRLV